MIQSAAVRPVVLCALLFFSVRVTADTALVSIWPVDSLTKVFPDDIAGTNRTAERIWLIPRNGHASIQIAVRSSTAIPAFSASLTVGGSLEAEVRRVGYVPVHANIPNTPTDELVRTAPGRFPDPLFEGDQFTVPANETTAFWITLYAPLQAVPGTYKAEAVLRAGQERVGYLQFQIRVVNATVPAMQALRISTWFYFDEHTMAPYFDVQDKPEKLWDLLGNIGRVMAAHKQNVFLTPVLSLTDARLNGGRLNYDFSRLDRFVDTVSRTGAMELIEGSHLVERAGGYDGPVKVPVFVADGGEVKREQLNPDDPRAKAQLESFLSALFVHLKEKGWLHRYVQHVLDEPHGNEPPVYMRYAAIVRFLGHKSVRSHGARIRVRRTNKGRASGGGRVITYPWREKNSIHSSIRLEAMREGIEDYELLHVLGMSKPDQAMRLAQKVIPHFTDYVRDVSAFRKLQAELLVAVR